MNKDDHIEYLHSLEIDYGKGFLCQPSREGAFYFGRYVTYDEYVVKYRERCVKEGFLTE